MATTVSPNPLVAGAPFGASERGSVVRNVTQTLWLTSTDHATDWGTDAAAPGRVLNDTKLPLAGDILDATFPNMFCVGRSVQMEMPERARVTIEYEYFPTSINASLLPAATTAGLKQVTTELDRQGLPIVVTHNSQNQNGEISVLDPEPTIAADVVYTLPAGLLPDAVMAAWVGATNNNPWRGGITGTWLCQRCDPRPLNAFAGADIKYIFSFQMVYDPTGQDPAVFWKDPATGRPPANLVLGTGYGTVPWHFPKNFMSEPI
mgnify:CR=1 FL=1